MCGFGYAIPTSLLLYIVFVFWVFISDWHCLGITWNYFDAGSSVQSSLNTNNTESSLCPPCIYQVMLWDLFYVHAGATSWRSPLNQLWNMLITFLWS